MYKQMKDWPSVSYIVCTKDNATIIRRCIQAIIEQDYPKERTEIIAVDGYSKDGTIEILKEIGVHILFNDKRPEGAGGAKWQGYHESKGDILIFIDSDNKLMQKDWTRQMISPLIKDDTIGFSICRLAVVKEDCLLNRYLSLVGTDPVVADKSIEALLAFKALELNNEGDYFTYNITPEKFAITGGYYFTIKRSTLKKIGGYTQDTDVVYNLAKKGLAKLAIPKNATIHHLIADKMWNFTKKKYKWACIYFKEGSENRDFHWIPDSCWGKLKVVWGLLKHLMFIPNLIQAVYLWARDGKTEWILHPFVSWLTASAYLSAYFKIKYFSTNEVGN